MAINYTLLNTKLTTDPRGYGFRALISTAEGGTKAGPSEDATIADLMNLVRNGSNPPATPTADGGRADGAILIRQPAISAKAIFEAIDVGDFPALPTNPNNSQLSAERRNLAWLGMLASQQTEGVRLLNADGSNTPVVTNLDRVFPVGTASRDRLLALATRFGSYAEELFKDPDQMSFSIDHMDIAKALGRG